MKNGDYLKMLSKEEFIGILNFIRDKRKGEENFIQSLEKLSPHTYCDCFLYDEYETKMIDLLENIFEDDFQDISYFIYELDGLNKKRINKKICPTKEGRILYSSLETLYDYLINKMSKSN
jgi:hypothetical protein